LSTDILGSSWGEINTDISFRYGVSKKNRRNIRRKLFQLSE